VECEESSQRAKKLDMSSTKRSPQLRTLDGNHSEEPTMTMRSGFAFLFALGILLTGSLLATAEPKPSPPSKPFKPVQPLEQMMEGQKKLFGEIKEAVGAKEWDEAETSAWILAEIANANHYQRDNAAYQGFADRVSAQCVQLASLAQKRDETAAKAMVNTIGQTCNACHEQFQKKKP